MITVTEETLMAYNDGELEPAVAEQVLAALQASPDLQERLERMKAMDELLRASIGADLSVPDRFSSLLAADDHANDDAVQGDNVVKLSPKKRAWRNWVPTGAGIAAAMLILVGGNVMAPASMSWLEQVEGGIALAGPVRQAMVTAPSGRAVQVSGLNVLPVVSFVSTDGRMCREAQLSDDEMAARIVACRDVAENEWCIEAFARMPTLPHRAGYTTASVPKDPVIDAAYARLGIKTTLSEEAEKAAIASDWAHGL
jgi:hypothetical protein